ncbi:MAG: MMPL family transporter [Butyricicoccus porcorum]
MTDRYQECRRKYDKKTSIIETISAVTVSILTSGITLVIVGFLLGFISTHGLLSQLGILLGRGSLCSIFSVLFVLPGLLYLFDGVVDRKNKKSKLYRRHEQPDAPLTE